MNHSIALAVCSSISLAACAHAVPPPVVAYERAGLSLPLVAISAVGRRVCTIGYADPVQCLYIDGERTRAVDVPGTEGAIDVAIGEERGCALFGSGAVTCFEWDGDGTTGGSLVPGLEDAFAFDIAVGRDLVCARSELGAVRCARGHERATDVVGLARTTQIAIDGERACARTEAGEVACWTATSPSAERVAGLAGVVSIAAGSSGMFAITSEGGLYRVQDWGRPAFAFGFATRVGTLAGAAELAVGPAGACAVTAHHETFCWNATSHDVARVGRLDDARTIAMGDRFACGLAPDGALRCAALARDAVHTRSASADRIAGR